MSLFGAARLYLVCADRIERDFTPSDDGTMPRRDGAWALWAKMGASPGEMEARTPLWRVQPGPVRFTRRSARA
jgi:hypothetical protein